MHDQYLGSGVSLSDTADAIKTIVLFIIATIVIVVIYYFTSGVKKSLQGLIPTIDINSKEEGEKCSTHAQCKGWVGGQPGTLGCCGGICTTLQKDWFGVGYCPDECLDAPSPLGKPGSCSSGNHWPRKFNEPCDTNVACETGLCKSGTCAPNCPNGTNQTVGTCWYDRGIGRIPDKYPCADGQRDDGTSCWVDTYGRGGGYAVWDQDKCPQNNPQGCEWYGAMVYPKCKAGYHAVGCCLCEPEGGPGIRKTLFDRQKCNGDERLEAGLCYKKPIDDSYGCAATICSKNR